MHVLTLQGSDSLDTLLHRRKRDFKLSELNCSIKLPDVISVVLATILHVSRKIIWIFVSCNAAFQCLTFMFAKDIKLRLNGRKKNSIILQRLQRKCNYKECDIIINNNNIPMFCCMRCDALNILEFISVTIKYCYPR